MQIKKWVNETDGVTFHLNGVIPVDRFFRACSIPSSPRPSNKCPDAVVRMGPIGACYTLFDSPQSQITVNTPGLLGALRFELDVAQDEYDAISLTESAAVFVSRTFTLCC